MRAMWTKKERAALPGCPGCGATCPARGCRVCKGEVLCGTCERELEAGGGFCLSVREAA